MKINSQTLYFQSHCIRRSASSYWIGYILSRYIWNRNFGLACIHVQYCVFGVLDTTLTWSTSCSTWCNRKFKCKYP